MQRRMRALATKLLVLGVASAFALLLLEAGAAQMYARFKRRPCRAPRSPPGCSARRRRHPTRAAGGAPEDPRIADQLVHPSVLRMRGQSRQPRVNSVWFFRPRADRDARARGRARRRVRRFGGRSARQSWRRHPAGRLQHARTVARTAHRADQSGAGRLQAAAGVPSPRCWPSARSSMWWSTSMSTRSTGPGQPAGRRQPFYPYA